MHCSQYRSYTASVTTVAAMLALASRTHIPVGVCHKTLVLFKSRFLREQGARYMHSLKYCFFCSVSSTLKAALLVIVFSEESEALNGTSSFTLQTQSRIKPEKDDFDLVINTN